MPDAPPDTRRAYRNIASGDRAPYFFARTPTNPRYAFDSAAGRWIVLGFIGSASDAKASAALSAAYAADDVFDDIHAALFTVSNDPQDENAGRISQRIPGRRVFWDFDGAVARAYGALPQSGDVGPDQPVALRRFWLIIDPSLVIRKVIAFEGADGGAAEMIAFLRAAPAPQAHQGIEVPPPVLVLPGVFEPDFCDQLVTLYDRHGGTESGFMRQQGDRTVPVMDRSFKSRSDYTLDDPKLVEAVQARITRRVIPEIARVHFFRCTRMERYIVARYSAEHGGHFKPHRDNTTTGTAHRRFAVSINLNADFDGGEVSFPEYSSKGIKGPKGSAVIFSCSLLHSVSKVASGHRYAFLPFLYDDAAAKVREANARLVANDASSYRASEPGRQAPA